MENSKNELIDILYQLSSYGIKYIVCGGVACVLQGVERATFDVDISISFEKENLEKVIKLAKDLKLIPRIPEPIEELLNEDKRIEWSEKKGALVYTLNFSDSPIQIDIFLNYPLNFDELRNKADMVKIRDFEFLISSKEDLLFVKKLIYPLRTKDKMDIEELEKLINAKDKSNQ